MIENTDIIKVKNRGDGTVGYKIPEERIRRQFQPNEEKEVTMGELRQLSYLPGGQYIIENCLIIEDEHAAKELLHQIEPEYFYTDDEIKAILDRGTMNQFLDCLDFAPQGVIDSIKRLAVLTKLNDMAKREAIERKTGFNVTKAIEINQEAEKLDEEVAEAARRADIPNFIEKKEKTTAPIRRTDKIITVKRDN